MCWGLIRIQYGAKVLQYVVGVHVDVLIMLELRIAAKRCATVRFWVA